ncbi:MAG: hypothetical protein P1V36_05730 [Planctomycetota bacterium]|nr:hypothetical protein [Planctomycetota bacterium]
MLQQVQALPQRNPDGDPASTKGGARTPPARVKPGATGTRLMLTDRFGW